MFHGLVLIEVSPAHLAAGLGSLRQRAAYPRFGFYSGALRDEETRAAFPAPPELGNYFLDNYRFFLARPQILWHVIDGPVEVRDHSGNRCNNGAMSSGMRDCHGLTAGFPNTTIATCACWKRTSG